MIHLSKIAPLIMEARLGMKHATLTLPNVDEVFRELSNLGIEEVKVTREEMNTIVYFFTVSTKDCDKELKTGLLETFLGVKLIL